MYRKCLLDVASCEGLFVATPQTLMTLAAIHYAAGRTAPLHESVVFAIEGLAPQPVLLALPAMG